MGGAGLTGVRGGGGVGDESGVVDVELMTMAFSAEAPALASGTILTVSVKDRLLKH